MRSNEPWCSCTRYTRTHTRTHTHRHTHTRTHTDAHTHTHTHAHTHAHNTHTRTHTTCTQLYTKLTNLVFLAREDFENVKRGDVLGNSWDGHIIFPLTSSVAQDYCQFLMDQCKVTRTRRTFDRALQALPLTQHNRIWPQVREDLRPT